MIHPVVIVIGWIGGSVVNGMVASAKNRNGPICVIISLILSPILVYLYVLAVPEARPKE